MAFNMDPKKCPMPTQDPNVRNKNFEEVALGYTEEMAVNEAKRCIHCKNKPCMQGCPVMVHIPDFIAEVAKGDFEAAYQIIAATSALPAVCGRVCPQESQCESKCVRGVKGEPVAIDRNVDAQTGTINIVGHIPNPNLTLRKSNFALRDLKKEKIGEPYHLEV